MQLRDDSPLPSNLRNNPPPNPPSQHRINPLISTPNPPPLIFFHHLEKTSRGRDDILANGLDEIGDGGEVGEAEAFEEICRGCLEDFGGFQEFSWT